jgi:hypothetical protein
MEWERVNDGERPPAGVSYDQWIQCQPGFAWRDAAACADPSTAPGSYLADNMWSPRRAHGAAYLHGALYVLGGRCVGQGGSMGLLRGAAVTHCSR